MFSFTYEKVSPVNGKDLPKAPQLVNGEAKLSVKVPITPKQLFFVCVMQKPLDHYLSESIKWV